MNSRRGFLLGAGVMALAGATTGCASAVAGPPAGPTTDPVVDPSGERQPGVDRPGPAQRFVRVLVGDLVPGADVRAMVSSLGAAAARLATAGHPGLAGLAPARLTTTVGLGPGAVGRLAPGLPGTTDLPAFPGDVIDRTATGGDVLLQVCADDHAVLSLASMALLATAAPALRLRWFQDGFRGVAASDGSARNLLGFADGVTVPRGADELNQEVWLDRPAGATIAVVRRMRVDVAGFAAQPLAAQEAAVGRRRDSSEPLSGGGPGADVDLGAKTPEGEFLIPSSAHVRRAHPALSGSGLMLRRGYAFDNGPGDAGQLFICFQRELHTFVATQMRLSEDDAMLRFARTTASGTFLVLPGALLR